MRARHIFQEDVHKGYENLAKIIPEKQYYRYSDHWRYVTQRLCFSAALVVFLEKGILVSKDVTAEILGVKARQVEGFHLDLEDYLMGILQLSAELVFAQKFDCVFVISSVNFRHVLRSIL